MSETPTEKPDKSKPPHWAIPVVMPVICVLITFVLTFGGTLYWTQHNNRIREFVYFVTATSNLLPKPAIPGKNVQVLIDNKPIGEISAVHISLFNTSDQDYEDVPIIVEFSSEDGKHINVIHASHAFKTGTGIEKDVSPTEPTPGTLRFEYKLSVANRNTDKDRLSLWYGDYVFETAKAPAVVVSIPKKGVTPVLSLPVQPEKGASLFQKFEPIALAILIVIAFIAIRYDNRALRKYMESARSKPGEAKESLSENEAKLEEKQDDPIVE